jgi:hypothetical protein
MRTATSPYPPDLSWWAVKRRQSLISRVHLPVSLTGPAPPGSADTSRRCQGCSHPPQRLPGQAAPSFTRPLRQSGNEGLSPPLDIRRPVAHVVFGPVDPAEHSQDLDPPFGRSDASGREPGRARSSLMAGLKGPTSHQPFHDPAHRHGPRSVAELDARVGARGNPCQRLEPRPRSTRATQVWAQRHAASAESRPISSKRARRPLVFRRSRPDTAGRWLQRHSIRAGLHRGLAVPERGRRGRWLSRSRDLDRGFRNPIVRRR